MSGPGPSTSGANADTIQSLYLTSDDDSDDSSFAGSVDDGQVSENMCNLWFDGQNTFLIHGLELQEVCF